jgi:fatty-acyl-CoA synthase
VRRPGAAVSPEELTALVAGRLARFKVPRHLLFIDAHDIPLTPSGRPRKFLLAQRAAAELGLQRLTP